MKFKRKIGVEKMIDERYREESIFPVGEENEKLAEYFIGQSYLKSLVADPAIPVGVSNVTFEAGSRNNWHIHRDGFQVLLATQGEGWFQEEGKPAISLKAGDVVAVRPDIKHWHGAKANHAFSHLSVSSGSIEWLEAVSDDVYQFIESNLKEI